MTILAEVCNQLMWRSSFVFEVKRDFVPLTDYGFLSDHMTKGYPSGKE